MRGLWPVAFSTVPTLFWTVWENNLRHRILRGGKVMYGVLRTVWYVTEGAVCLYSLHQPWA